MFDLTTSWFQWACVGVFQAAILQHTTEYIANMEQEKNKLVAQNEQLKRMVLEMGRERDIERQNESPPPKRKKRDTGMC